MHKKDPHETWRLAVLLTPGFFVRRDPLTSKNNTAAPKSGRRQSLLVSRWDQIFSILRKSLTEAKSGPICGVKVISQVLPSMQRVILLHLARAPQMRLPRM